jgi:competence protein ComEC
MLLVAIFFAAGIGLMQWRWLPPAVLLYALLLCGLLTLTALLRAPRVMLLPLCVMWCTLGWLAAELEPPTPSQNKLLQEADGLSRRMTGSVERVMFLHDERAAGAQDVSAPQPAQTVMLDVQLSAIEEITPDVSRMVPVRGGVRLMLYAPKNGQSSPVPQWRCGEIIATSAILHPPEKFLDPGAWDYAAYLAAQNVSTHAAVNEDAVTGGAEESAGWHLACRIHVAQSWACEQLAQYPASRTNQLIPGALQIHDEDAGALAAMLFGDRTRLDRTLKTEFVSTGSFHLFVVSGLHIALIAGMVFFYCDGCTFLKHGHFC